MNKLVRLFSLQSQLNRTRQTSILLVLFSLILSACGGESTESGLFQGSTQAGNPVQSPSEPSLPEPTISATPRPTAAPGQVVTATPRPTPEPQTGLSAPSLATSLSSQTLNVSWSNVNAAAYRLLVWQGDTSAPIVVTTNNLNSSLALADAGSYTVMVEAYDALGNSVFSEPRTLEVTQ